MRYLIIDGNAFLYRAYYATSHWMAKQANFGAVQTNGVFVAMKMLKKFLTQTNPADFYQRLFVAFDLGKATFRHQAYQAYKGNRPKTPETLIEQIPLFKQFLKALKLNVFEDSEHEADDLIASLTSQILKQNPTHQIDLLSGDRDLLQLVRPQVRLLIFQTGISKLKFVDHHTFADLFQIQPTQVVDYKALVGDPSDNLPGIGGIGPKTAQQLLRRFPSLEAMLANEQQLPAKVRKRLDPATKNRAQWVKKLAQLKGDIPLKVPLAPLKIDFANPHLQQLFAKYHMKSLLRTDHKKQQKFAF